MQVLRALGRLLLAESEAELAPQRQRVLAALGTNAGLVTALLPEFAILLGVQPDVMSIDPIEADVRLQLVILTFARDCLAGAPVGHRAPTVCNGLMRLLIVLSIMC